MTIEKILASATPLTEITPEIAQELIDKAPFAGQRPRRAAKVAEYAEQIRIGKFIPSTIKAVILPDGTRSVLDGQHRLHAVLAAGKSIWVDFMIHEAPLETARDYYARTDINIIRNHGDRLHSYGVGEALGLTAEQLRSASSAVKVILDGFVAASLGKGNLWGQDVDMVRDQIFHWEMEIKAFFQAVAHGEPGLKKALCGGAVMGVALATFKYAPKEAAEFWQLVAENDGLGRDTPPHRLVRYLFHDMCRDRHANVRSRCVARCWNAFFKRQAELKNIRPYQVEMKPIEISGTPYNGKEDIRLVQGYLEEREELKRAQTAVVSKEAAVSDSAALRATHKSKSRYGKLPPPVRTRRQTALDNALLPGPVGEAASIVIS